MKKSNAGFSLVELMVVVAIIGVLATIAVPQFSRFRNKARAAEAKVHLAGIATGVKSFFTEYNCYVGGITAIGYQHDGNPNYRYGWLAAIAPAGCIGTPPAAGTSSGGNAAAPALVAYSATNLAFTAGATGTLTTTDTWQINELLNLQQTTVGY